MQFFRTKKILAIIGILAFIINGCRKEQNILKPENQSNDKLWLIFQDNKIKINQAISIADTTFLRDSIDFVSPPSYRHYEWEIIPNNGCDSVMGDKNLGHIAFIFKCSGTYLITAKFFDSTQNLIGNTDTLELNVTSDTLYPTQPIKEDDTLNIRTGLAKSYTDTSLPPYEVYPYLILLSTKFYDGYVPYIQFDYTSNISPNNYSYTFTDVGLNSYPFNPRILWHNKQSGWRDRFKRIIVWSSGKS